MANEDILKKILERLEGIEQGQHDIKADIKELKDGQNRLAKDVKDIKKRATVNPL